MRKKQGGVQCEQEMQVEKKKEEDKKDNEETTAVQRTLRHIV
jgi:hypothetical protein